MKNDKGREMKKEKVRKSKVCVKKCVDFLLKRKMTLLLWNGGSTTYKFMVIPCLRDATSGFKDVWPNSASKSRLATRFYIFSLTRRFPFIVIFPSRKKTL